VNTSPQMLVGNVHSTTDCTAAGGIVVYERVADATYLGTAGSIPTDSGFCKFSFPTPNDSNACPSSWAQYKSYARTEGSFTPFAYVQMYTASYYSVTSPYGCDTPMMDNEYNIPMNSQGVMYSGTEITLSDGFKNGPVNSMTRINQIYYDHSCSGDGTAPAPNPPAFPIVMNSIGDKAWYAARSSLDQGLNHGLDWLFPDAHAKAACNGSLYCRETTYSNPIQLQRKEIGCF
jgi:hypothetical protein